MDTMKQGSTLKPVERMKPHFANPTTDSTSDLTTYVTLSLDMHDYTLPRNTNGNNIRTTQRNKIT